MKYVENVDFITAMLEQERQRIEQLTAGWDDPTQVEWGTEEQANTVPSVAVSAPPGEGSAPIIYKCVALYSYTVSVQLVSVIFPACMIIKIYCSILNMLYMLLFRYVIFAIIYLWTLKKTFLSFSRLKIRTS